MSVDPSKCMFTCSVHDPDSPPIPFFELDQPAITDLWRRGNRMFHTLSLMVFFDQRIRAFLQERDPNAFEQAMRALESADPEQFYNRIEPVLLGS